MGEPTYRVEYADGRSEEIPFTFLPLIRLEFEEEHGTSVMAYFAEHPEDEAVLLKAVFRWMQLRGNVTAEFRDWLATVDALVPVGAMARLIEATEKAMDEAGDNPEDSDPLAESGSSTGSVGHRKSAAKPSET